MSAAMAGSVLRLCETALLGPVDVLSRGERSLEELQREDAGHQQERQGRDGMNTSSLGFHSRLARI